jgi:hypothetical protein
MENMPELTKNEKKIYDIINKDCFINVFCYRYIQELSRISRLQPKQTITSVKCLEEKGYIKTYCKKTPFCRRSTIESDQFSAKQDGFLIKYKKTKDKDILYKVLEERGINTIKLWLYIKLISLLQKKSVTTLKEVVDEIAVSQDGKHNWVNSMFLKKFILDIEYLGFSQWEPLAPE